MTVFKCKMCGGQITLDSKNGIAICDYCGTKQALPLFSDDSERLLYESGNNYLSHNEYDKAENVFNQLLTIKPNAAELYWDLVLCKYGVTYVKDPKTAKYIPTCNRTHYASIFNDENYNKAIEYANEEQKAIFQSDAKYIDDVQKSIVAIAKSEKPFDIFICYKETAQNGARSKDSVKAQEIYENLTAQGYKVFFSRITLESKIGTEYEPYIYAALASSKVMIHITSSKENSEAVWVKNEWSRYLSLSSKSNDKTFIPVYFDISKDELPEEFVNTASYNMNTDGFMQELTRGIKKLIPTPVMKLQRKKKMRKVFGLLGAALVVVLVAVGIYSYPKIVEYIEYKDDYDAAMQLYYDKNYPEATWAFEELGDFLDSKEMKTTAESSWRKNVATVIAKDLWSYSAGVYYVDSNGTVDTFEGREGSSHKGIKIDDHGKVISLGTGEQIYALHEDGYVSNAVENNELKDDSEWHNIIKISPFFNCTNVALRADGKMLYGRTIQNETEYVYDDTWLEEISTWENIVDFVWCGGCSNEFNMPYSAIIGIKSDGTLVAVETLGQQNNEFHSKNSLNKIISKFKNVKSLRFYETAIIALTKDNKLQSFIYGEFSEIELKDVYDVIFEPEYYFSGETNYKMYLLKSNGDCVDMESGNVLLSDVVYFCDQYINGRSGYELDRYVVTRTGSIYCVAEENYGSINLKVVPQNVKTIVHDEWVERLN